MMFWIGLATGFVLGFMFSVVFFVAVAAHEASKGKRPNIGVENG